jgi:transcriptional regulator with XRE-family HTH domain
MSALQSLPKYESGKSTPSSRVLLDLSKALGVRTEYFFRPVKIELREVKHRKHSQLPKKALEQIEGDVKEQLERFIELEELLPNGPVQAFKLPDNLAPPIPCSRNAVSRSSSPRQSMTGSTA